MIKATKLVEAKNGINCVESTVEFVVGIGASAGGLRSLEKLIGTLVPHSQSAFVVVQHFAPEADSCMVEILSRYTTMPVVSVEQEMSLEPSTIYLIPPGKEIYLNGRVFGVSHLDREEIPRPIDTFFKSLAESYGERAIGMVLSGTGSDGSLGIEMIHRMSGTTIVESLETAQFDGMPRNALATDCIDLVLPPSEIACWLNEQFENPAGRVTPNVLGEQELTGFNLIFSLLSESYNVEFSFYKPETVARRIKRRQVACDKPAVLDYAEFLRGNSIELELLYHDLLIGVTKFFRDTEAFKRLEHYINERVHAIPLDEELRIWSAGCSTGEEPYSIAIICLEAFESAGKEPNFKIFATDADDGSLDRASKGIFISDALGFVGLERQKKFFVRESDSKLRVGPDLRRHMVFAHHNVVQDPPFTKLDLMICRNLLIYLKTEAQFRAISSFHFALKREGIMMLGPSESPGKLSDEFEIVDESWKIYRKLRDLPSQFQTMSNRQRTSTARPRKLINLLNNDRPETMSFTGLVDSYELVLGQFIESGLLLDDKRNVLHLFGDSSKYLNSGTESFSGSIMGFLAGDFKVAFASGLIRAQKEMGKQIILEGLRLSVGDAGFERSDVSIRAITSDGNSSFVWLVSFDSRPTSDADGGVEVPDVVKVNVSTDAFAAMESELIYTQESLSSTIEEVETSNGKLQSANEQLVAANEELQSTNEELHSVNEELYSVNAENQRKIGDLEEMTDDVDNLLANTDVGIIFLNSKLQVRKFTNAAAKFVKLQSNDIGREITDFALQVKTPYLYKQLEEVMTSGEGYSTTAETKTGERVFIKITPYLSNRSVKGAILNFIEISEVGA